MALTTVASASSSVISRHGGEPDESTGRWGQRAARLQIHEHVFPRTRDLRVFIERLQPLSDDALDSRRHGTSLSSTSTAPVRVG